MNQQTVDDRIMWIISQLSAVRPGDIKPKDRLREDLGMDSVSSMELLSMLAEELDLDVAIEEAVGVTTVEGVIALAQKHLDAKRVQARA